MNKIIWGVAILGGGYLLYNYSKNHFLSTRKMNEYIIKKDKFNFLNMDDKYVQNWADATKNGLKTFAYNGSTYNTDGGTKVK